MKLFGGAIVADIPCDLRDASDLREVPDNQEVYVGTFRDTDLSLIVELLEPVPETDLVEALTHHVQEAHRLSGINKETSEYTTEFFSSVLGHHEFAGRVDTVKTPRNEMLLTFGLFRLTKFEVDVLVTCVVTLDEGQQPNPADRDTQKDTVLRLVESFKVIDPTLFINEKKEFEEKQKEDKKE